MQWGLKAGQSGKIYATAEKNLTPLQAQQQLALPNKGISPSHVIEIDVQSLQDLGIKISPPETIPPHYGYPGGGQQYVIDTPEIPPSALTVKR
jgi:hypothetical protein